MLLSSAFQFYVSDLDFDSEMQIYEKANNSVSVVSQSSQLI